MLGAVRLFLKQAVIRRRLPFEVIAEDPFWSETNQRMLAESIRSLEEGKGERQDPSDEIADSLKPTGTSPRTPSPRACPRW